MCCGARQRLLAAAAALSKSLNAQSLYGLLRLCERLVEPDKEHLGPFVNCAMTIGQPESNERCSCASTYAKDLSAGDVLL